MRNGQGRRRNRGPRPQQGTSTGQPPRPEQSARMDARVRGNAHQLLEKYRNMARDATLAGDRITAEYYLQYADHYYRVLNENRPRTDESRQRPGRDWQDRDDHDMDDEEVEARATDPARDGRDQRDGRPDQVRADQAAGAAEGERPERGSGFERSERDRSGADRARPARAQGDAPGERDLQPGGPAHETADAGPSADPADGDDDAGIIALAALPPPISRPAARSEDAVRLAAPRRTRRAAGPEEPDALRGDLPGGVGGAAATATAPRRRGRPPKVRPAEADAAPLEDA